MPRLINADGGIRVMPSCDWLLHHRSRVTGITIAPSSASAFAWYMIAFLGSDRVFVELFRELAVCRRLAYRAAVEGPAGASADGFPNAAITDHTRKPLYKHDEFLYPAAIFLGRSCNTDLYVLPGPYGFIPMARTDAQSVIYPLQPFTPAQLAQYRRAKSPLAVAHDLAVAAGLIPEVDRLEASMALARE
jgi:hypothetical protein